MAPKIRLRAFSSSRDLSLGFAVVATKIVLFLGEKSGDFFAANFHRVVPAVSFPYRPSDASRYSSRFAACCAFV